MKPLWPFLLALIVTATVLADTPPPGQVKLKGGTDGTLVGNVADALKVNVTNSASSTVSQGAPGPLSSPWPVIITTPVPVTISSPIPVIVSTPLPVSQSGAWTTGRTWDLNSGTDSVSIAGSITASNPSVGPVPSPVPTQATLVGAKDGSGNLQDLNITAAGALKVDGSAVTQPVSGALTANQGTSPWVIDFSSPQPVTQSGAWSLSVSNFPASQTVNGTVTSNQGGAPWSFNLTQILGAAPSATNWMPSRITNGTSFVDPTQIRALTTSDQVTAFQGGSPWSVSGSGTFQTNVTNASIPVTQSGSWTTAVTQTTSPWIVGQTTGANLHADIDNFPATQAISAVSLPLPTGASTAANQTSQITQETTTATNTTSILANQTNGTQKTQVTSLPVDVATATQNVTVQDTGSVTTAYANSQNFITGTATAGSAASFSISSVGSIEVMVSGTWTGTLESDISFDGGTTWYTRGVKQAGASYISSSFTQNFAGGLNIAGMTNYRIRATAAMTGTATVKIVSSVNEESITVTNPLTLRDATTQSVTSAIKPSGTAALTTDNALVVAVSPNNTPVLPSGASTAANQTNGSQKTQVVDGSGNVQGPMLTVSGTNYAPVTVAASGTSGSTAPARTLQLGGSNGTNLYTWLMDSLGIGQVSLGNTSKTIVSKTGSLSTSTTTSNQVILTYTVTTGKTFYIEEADCGVVLNSAAATQEQFGTCSLSINGVVVWSQYYKGPGAGSFQPTLTYPEPIFATSGQVVLWETTPAATGAFLWTANFGGYEK